MAFPRIVQAILLCCFPLTSKFCFTFGFVLSRQRHPSLVGINLLVDRTRKGTPKKEQCKTTALFGIKGFRSWFESQFPDAIVNVQKDKSRETFDHVLIDLNQLLHTVLRKSRSDDHAFALMFRDLDELTQMATPKHSLVIAMDGAPPTAKLATQRKRRFSTIARNNWKIDNFDMIGKRFTKSQRERKLRAYRAEMRSLQISPGTDFMVKAEEALLYWAWQRLQRGSRSHLKTVKIFLSSSSMPGEGEVKLLDWMVRAKVRPGSTVAILGGDSDLVLESMTIPPQWTHNLFVLIPDAKQSYTSVSIWETTRTMERNLPQLSPEAIMHVRNDFVILLILNGNDYLPGLRGSRRFNNIVNPYLRLVQEWPSILSKRKGLSDKVNGSNDRINGPFMVDPETLEFNLQFCIEFFRRLARVADFNEQEESKEAPYQIEYVLMNALSQIHNFADAGFLPQPIDWTVIRDLDQSEVPEELMECDEEGDGQTDEEEGWDEGDDEDDDWDSSQVGSDTENGYTGHRMKSEEVQRDKGSMSLLKLTLGDIDSDDSYQYELWFPDDAPISEAKGKLSLTALKDIFGSAPGENDSGTFGQEDSNASSLVDHLTFGSTPGYDWEVKGSEENVELYLAGLLWNLQTYQDGVCADYGFNYGKRLAPTAKSIADYIEETLTNNKNLNKMELLGSRFTPPVPPGLACLAALPSQMKELVPEPYRLIPDQSVEEFYAASMSSEDNVFDVEKFKSLCHAEIKKITGKEVLPDKEEDSAFEFASRARGHPIPTKTLHWTVLERRKIPASQTSTPPKPFSDRLSYLRKDENILVTLMKSTGKPRDRGPSTLKPGVAKKLYDGPIPKPPKRVNARRSELFISSDLHPLLRNHKKLCDVPYKVAYPRDQPSGKKKKKSKFTMSIQVQAEPSPPPRSKEPISTATKPESPPPKMSPHTMEDEVVKEMKHAKMPLPPFALDATLDGHAAISCLKQLEEANLLTVKWELTMPSESQFAAQWPRSFFEEIRLTATTRNDDGNGTTTAVKADRFITKGTRREYRHHLASKVLSQIVDPNWKGLTYNEMRALLSERVVKN